MKYKNKIFFLMMIAASANSQTLSPTVIASAGGNYSGGGASLSWTLGETVVHTLQAGGKMLTQGFQQPYNYGGVVNLRLFIDGFYSGGGMMSISGTGCLNLLEPSDPMYSPDPDDVDDVTVTAMHPESFLPVESVVGRLKTNGDLTVTYTGPVITGAPYFLRLTHRNLVETWSKYPVTFLRTTNYDFTIASTQAYDDGFILPMKQVSSSPVIWAVYNGDIDHDGAVDAIDMTFEENVANAGLFGYYPTDLNGDGGSDALDMTIIENNTNNGIFSAHP